MPLIYHVTTAADWNKAQETGSYTHPSLNAEGFIHCSEEQQVAGVLERYFAGQKDLVKLVIDTTLLTSSYVSEWSPSVNDHFPHIYGPINTGAVTGVIAI